jgi:hypothetical protein
MIHGAGVQVPDWRVVVVAGRCHVPSTLVVVVVVVVVGQKLGIELVPTVRRNIPPIVADLTLGALAAAVVLMTTTIIATLVLATTGLVTSRLAAVRCGVALATIRAAISTIARARLIGIGLARSTNRILRSARLARVGVETETQDGVHRAGPIRGLILLFSKSLE